MEPSPNLRLYHSSHLQNRDFHRVQSQQSSQTAPKTRQENLLGFLVIGLVMASYTLSAIIVAPSSTSQSSFVNNSVASPSFLQWRLNPYDLSTSFFGRQLSIRPSNLRHLATKHRPAVATVLFSLPTA